MKKKIKDLTCKDLECSECPFDYNCEWVSQMNLSFKENFEIYIKEIKEKLEKEKEVKDNED